MSKKRLEGAVTFEYRHAVQLMRRATPTQYTKSKGSGFAREIATQHAEAHHAHYPLGGGNRGQRTPVFATLLL